MTTELRPPVRGWSRKDSLLAIAVAALLVLRVVSLVAVLNSGQERQFSILGGDSRRYHQITSSYGTPYEDYQVEYPPVIFGLLKLVDADKPLAALVKLGISQLLFDVATAVVLAWCWGRRTAIAYLVLGLPFLLYPYVYLRVDLVTVFIVTAGLALVRRHKDRSGAALLAVAVFAKLYPVALAPLFVLERRWKALTAWAAAMVAILAAWIAWAGLSGPIEVFSFRGATGWQLESLPGIVLHMLDPTRARVESGAWRTGTMPGWGRPFLTFVSFGFVALAWWWAARRRREGAGDDMIYAVAPLACILSLLIFAPIISPQYMLWLLPFSSILAARSDRVAAIFMLAIGALSTAGMAMIQGQIYGDWYATVTVAVRNAVLVAFFIFTLLRLAGITAAPKPPASGPAPDDNRERALADDTTPVA